MFRCYNLHHVSYSIFEFLTRSKLMSNKEADSVMASLSNLGLVCNRNMEKYMYDDRHPFSLDHFHFHADLFLIQWVSKMYFQKCIFGKILSIKLRCNSKMNKICMLNASRDVSPKSIKKITYRYIKKLSKNGLNIRVPQCLSNSNS